MKCELTSMSYSDIIALARILKSKTCLVILNFLTKNNASNQEIYDALKDKVDIEYRSSIFEALKRIKGAGLIEKYYDDNSNQIKYRVKVNSISLDFDTMDLTTK